MGRTLIFMKLKQFTPDQMANYLKAHPAYAKLLGYRRESNGSFEIPCGETFRVNLKKRFGGEGVKKTDHLIASLIRKEAEKLGVDSGECCGSDAFPVAAVSSDENAGYNGSLSL